MPKRPTDAAPIARDELPIVGVGASTAGLDALDQFLRNLPEHNDAAVIVVIRRDTGDRELGRELGYRELGVRDGGHRDGAHRDPLAELRELAAYDAVAAVDGAQLEPGRIYAILPGETMAVVRGALHAAPPASDAARALPIDFLFRSLALDQGERSIGVILAGASSDGTLGLRAIKEAAGATFVQSLGSARLGAAPRSAIDAGFADVVAAPEDLPLRIAAYRDHAALVHGDRDNRPSAAQAAVDRICALLRDRSGNDFALYKRSTIYRRIERRMGLHQIDSHTEYLRFLRERPGEVDTLFDELLIGVTSFFRDPAEWDRLCQEVLPSLVAQRAPAGTLRAWLPGCSTGEEAYSLAIVLREALDPVEGLRNVAIQIFATDLDRQAVESARHGVYPENIAADVSPERLRRFFIRDDRGYRVSKDIRDAVVFAPQNVIVDPPFTKIDIVACRNLMIYLSTDVQRRLIPLFHYCLNPGGVLFLGTAETVGQFANLFAPLDGSSRIYRRLDQSVALPLDLEFASFGRARSPADDRGSAPPLLRPASVSVQVLVDRLLVQRFAPLGVLCDTKGDVLYVSGRAGKFLEPPVGKANFNILAMAREGLRFELSRAFAKALRHDRVVTVNGLTIGSDGGRLRANLSVQKLVEPSELAGTVIVVLAELEPIVNKPVRPRAGARPHELEEELQRSREQIQTVREEMQTSQEELKSTNEELQSTNEELQSTNEELTTSKEEMQSLNEELQTVNHELQAKVDELSRANSDIANRLDATEIATVFLDNALRIRRFTPATAQIIKLIPADIGRPVTDIVSDLEYPQLTDDAREVLRALVPYERHAVTRGGRAFAVRVMPYRRLDGAIDGVVITFTDTTALHALETAAREQAHELRQMAESLPHLVFGARGDGAFEFVNLQWVEYTGVAEAEQLQDGWLDQVHAGDRERVRDEWRAAVRGGTGFDSELRLRSAAGVHRWFEARAAAIRSAAGDVVRWYGSATDIDERRRVEERLAGVLAAIRDGFVGLDGELAITAINPIAERMLSCRASEVVGHALADALPALAELGDALRRGPVEAEIVLDAAGFVAQVQRNRDGGYLIFLRSIDGED